MTRNVRLGRVIAVDGVPLRKSEETPRTVGEVAADRPSQQADRALIDRQHAIERELAIKYGLLHSFGLARDRKRQRELSADIDMLEAELNQLRPILGATGDRHSAGSELAKTDRARGADALNTVMHTPSIKKAADLPDPFALSNDLGVRSQARIRG